MIGRFRDFIAFRRDWCLPITIVPLAGTAMTAEEQHTYWLRDFLIYQSR